jgi:hypothetical protein
MKRYNVPAAGQLWSFLDTKDLATRYLRVSDVDSRYVHGYAWWEEGPSGNGRSTRIQRETVMRRWKFVPEADKADLSGGAA